jgi:GntR family transcriptional regulator
VRELARLLQVNPLTVQKAYRRLTDLGLLEVRRGEGTIVSATPPAPAAAERARKLREAAERFAEQARNLRATKEEILSLLNEVWPDTEGPADEEER